jgi:hypothetical protein
LTGRASFFTRDALNELPVRSRDKARGSNNLTGIWECQSFSYLRVGWAQLLKFWVVRMLDDIVQDFSQESVRCKVMRHRKSFSTKKD